ncbi:Exostosin family protein [Klebsormidium nitens]|uniref:Exostosin family protein n=1 Tax=Klebsormidium nitens TaxID=105231 RepID=A0A1Y1IJ37_KLENI|nr:Exostosin family protein [Klebsormidium nitens]|eukprot:GAQ88716.1 Exostosin family protein [Klebsormidium nitens]
MQSSAFLSKAESRKGATRSSRFGLLLFALLCLALTWPLLFGEYQFKIQFDVWQTPEIRFLKQVNEHKQAQTEGGLLGAKSDIPGGVKWHGSVPHGRKDRGEKLGGCAGGLNGEECNSDGAINGRALSERPQGATGGGQEVCQVDGSACKGVQEKLRVFVYELPANMSTDFYKHPSAMQGSNSAEWWIYRDLVRLRPDSTSPAVRVSDPAQADVFFVPFMGSQAFLCADSAQYTLVDHADVCGELKGKNHQLQEELHTWLAQQEPWRRSGGVDHVFMLVHPLALDRKRTDFRQALFLLTDFAQAWSWEVSLTKDVVVPYMHVVESLPRGVAADMASSAYLRNLTTLLFFTGNLQRLGMGAVRKQLADLLADAPDVIIRSANTGNVVTSDLLSRTADEMRRSRFCLHPAGDTPSSSRIFDAIVNLCIPVVVSDDLELPFEDQLDYSEFSVFVKERDAVQPGVLLQRLRTISDETVLRMRQKLLEVRDYFEYSEPWSRRVSAQSLIWREVAARVPSIRLRMARKRREAPQEQPATMDNLRPERNFHLNGNWSDS